MKTLFFTGKGGVGKSTISAACAWQLAEEGKKVLALSLDPAHNLGDIYGLKLTHKKKKFTKNLYLQEIDLNESASEYINTNKTLMGEIYGYLKPFHMDEYFKVLVYSPGVEEYAALTALEKLFREETAFDYLVIDTPPTGLTLRILALPHISQVWINQLIRIRKEILKKRHTIHNLMGKYQAEGVALSFKEEDDPVMQKLRELLNRYTALNSLLQGSKNGIVLIFNPDLLSLKESQRLMQGVAELGLPLRIAFNNKYAPEKQELADKAERELLKNKNGIIMARVPLVQHIPATAYVMDYDFTQFILR